MRKERIDNLIPIGYNESNGSRVEIASRKKKKRQDHDRLSPETSWHIKKRLLKNIE